MARRAGSPIFVAQTRYLNVKGSAELQRRIAALPAEMIAHLKPAVERGANDMAGKLRSIAPVSDLEGHPGELKASIHTEPGRHELSVAVIVDARDAAGKAYPAHVEYGHRTKGGVHVPAVRFFWVTYNVLKKRIRARMARAVTAAAKAVISK